MDQHPAVLVDTRHSPYCRLRPLPLTAVRLDDAFWRPRRERNRTATLPSQHQLCEETGRIANFRRAAGKLDGPFRGLYFNDSDVYKWLEAAAWTLATDEDPLLARLVEDVIGAIESAQQPDGYLNTYFMGERAAERWTNLRDMHELYCAGHLIQAAIAHFRATGSRRLLRVARRLADHIDGIFGPKGRPGAPGHEEIEMALVELARVTGEARYRRLARFFLDQRGRGVIGGREYHQDKRPIAEMARMEGHAVRAVYLMAGAADLVAENGDAQLHEACQRLWESMVARQMYISGGIGSRHEGEAFGEDYELPNARAYAESCAAIGVFMWSWRMLLLEGEARYADLMERTLYNGILVGLGLDGRSYFYYNPLADEGELRRQAWFECACCPPNLARLLASLPGYFYSQSADGIWVHLYAKGSADFEEGLSGRSVHLKQQTDYPWGGNVRIKVEGRGKFSLFLRLPGWCDAPELQINAERYHEDLRPGSYAEIRRSWRPGDVVDLRLPMPARFIEAHPYVVENRGRVALMRGPLLYCLEQADHPDFDVRDVTIAVEADEEPLIQFRPDLLAGVVTIQFPGVASPPDEGWAARLYRPLTSGAEPAAREVTLTAIPYYAWANRKPGPMRVWLPRAS